MSRSPPRSRPTTARAFLPGALESVFAQTRPRRRGARRRRRLDRRHARRARRATAIASASCGRRTPAAPAARNTRRPRGARPVALVPRLRRPLDAEQARAPGAGARGGRAGVGDGARPRRRDRRRRRGARRRDRSATTSCSAPRTGTASRTPATPSTAAASRSALTARVDAVRDVGALRPGAAARRLRPLPAARARLRDRLPRRAADGALPPPRGADDDLRADDGPDPDRREAPRAARRARATCPTRDLARRNFLLMLARSYAVLERPARVARATCSGRCGSTRARSAEPWVPRAARRLGRASDEARAPHRDPGAVPDPALQRARRAASTCACSSSPQRDPRRGVLRAARATSGASSTTSLPRPQLRRGGRWLVLSRGRRLRELRRFRARRGRASAAGTSPRSGARSPTAEARRIPLLVWVESTARDARSRGARRSSSRSARWCARATGVFVPGHGVGRVRALARRRAGSDRDRAERRRRERLRAGRGRAGPTGRLHVPLRRPARSGEGARHAARGVPRRAGRARARRLGTRRRPRCGRSPATACASRARWTATRSSS